MKKMIKLLFATLFVGLFFNPIAQVNAQDASWEKIQKDGKLIVGVEGTYWPHVFHDGEKLVGYEADLIEAIAKRLNLTVEYKEMQVDGLLTSLETGQIDVIAGGFTITPARQEKFLFSTPTKYTFGSIIVREDGSSGIETIEDFAGKKAAGGATTTFMQVATSKGAEPVVYDNVDGATYLRDVENGRTDFIPNDYYVQTAFVKAVPDFKVKVGNVFYNPSQSAFVYNKESVTLQTKIDEQIEALRKEGFLTETSKKYFFGEDVSVEKEEIGGVKLEELPVIEVK